MAFAPLLSNCKAAERLNLAPGTLNAWRVKGKGPPFVKVGRKVGYRPEDVDKFIVEQLRGSTRESSSATEKLQPVKQGPTQVPEGIGR